MPDIEIDISNKTFFVKEQPTFPASDMSTHKTFVSGGQTFSQITIYSDGEVWYGNDTVAYANGEWEIEYRYLTFGANQTMPSSDYDKFAMVYDEYTAGAKKLYFRIDNGEYKLATLNGKNKGVWDGVAWDNTPTYSIVPMLMNVTADSGNPTTVRQGETAILTFTADSGYSLPDTVTVTGATGLWNKATGTMVISGATGTVRFTIGGVPQGETWLINADGGAFWGNAFTANITFDTYAEGEYRTFNTFVYGETYLQYDNGVVYNSLGWRDEGYRTVYFHTAPTGELRNYLLANATLQ